MHMNMAARALERVGDNAVDIAEQVAFLITGEFREFADASDPGDDLEPDRRRDRILIVEDRRPSRTTGTTSSARDIRSASPPTAPGARTVPIEPPSW